MVELGHVMDEQGRWATMTNLKPGDQLNITMAYKAQAWVAQKVPTQVNNLAI